MPDHSDSLSAAVQNKNLLFDFYGGLLTKKQSEYFVLHYMEDLSLSEISEQMNVTPQAVTDLLKRACAQLDTYEATLGLVQKYAAQSENLKQIYETLDKIAAIPAVRSDPANTLRMASIRIWAEEMVL